MRMAVLVSGNGTNLQALLDAQEAQHLAPAQISLVICNRPGAVALQRAEQAALPYVLIDHTAFATRALFEKALLRELAAHDIEAILLAGFMRILSPVFIQAFAGRILNTHPALCPSFPGINAPQQAIDAGVKVSGCTVHFVDTGVDTGPIVFQEALAVAQDDTAATLHARIQVLEHRLLPQAASYLAKGWLAISGKQVQIHTTENTR